MCGDRLKLKGLVAIHPAPRKAISGDPQLAHAFAISAPMIFRSGKGSPVWVPFCEVSAERVGIVPSRIAVPKHANGHAQTPQGEGKMRLGSH
jgi:hypothetical protein